MVLCHILTDINYHFFKIVLKDMKETILSMWSGSSHPLLKGSKWHNGLVSDISAILRQYFCDSLWHI